MTNVTNINRDLNTAFKKLVEEFKLQEFLFIAETPEKYEMHIRTNPDVRLLGMVEMAKSHIVNELTKVTEKRHG